MRIQFQGTGRTAVLSLGVLTQLEKCVLDTANHHAAIPDTLRNVSRIVLVEGG
jgi:hypothetical protein